MEFIEYKNNDGYETWTFKKGDSFYSRSTLPGRINPTWHTWVESDNVAGFLCGESKNEIETIFLRYGKLKRILNE